MITITPGRSEITISTERNYFGIYTYPNAETLGFT